MYTPKEIINEFHLYLADHIKKHEEDVIIITPYSHYIDNEFLAKTINNFMCKWNLHVYESDVV